MQLWRRISRHLEGIAIRIGELFRSRDVQVVGELLHNIAVEISVCTAGNQNRLAIDIAKGWIGTIIIFWILAEIATGVFNGVDL